MRLIYSKNSHSIIEGDSVATRATYPLWGFPIHKLELSFVSLLLHFLKVLLDLKAIVKNSFVTWGVSIPINMPRIHTSLHQALNHLYATKSCGFKQGCVPVLIAHH